MPKSFMADMSWNEFQDALKEDTVLVIPMGSTELAGPHLPLGADTMAAEGLAKRLAGEKEVLIAPCLPLGYSKWFQPYAGNHLVGARHLGKGAAGLLPLPGFERRQTHFVSQLPQGQQLRGGGGVPYPHQGMRLKGGHAATYGSWPAIWLPKRGSSTKAASPTPVKS